MDLPLNIIHPSKKNVNKAFINKKWPFIFAPQNYLSLIHYKQKIVKYKIYHIFTYWLFNSKNKADFIFVKMGTNLDDSLSLQILKQPMD